MKLLFCHNCYDAFGVIEKKRKCKCGETSAILINNQIVFTGDRAIPINIVIADNVSSFVPSWILSHDTEAVQKKSQLKIHPDDHLFFVKVIEYLNDKAGTKYATTAGSAAFRLIIQRKNENRVSAEDFFKVIDNKVAQWKGTNYEIYLRPITLFNKSKFENYLGENGFRKSATSDAGLFEQFAGAVGSAQKLLPSAGK